MLHSTVSPPQSVVLVLWQWFLVVSFVSFLSSLWSYRDIHSVCGCINVTAIGAPCSSSNPVKGFIECLLFRWDFIGLQCFKIHALSTPAAFSQHVITCRSSKTQWFRHHITATDVCQQLDSAWTSCIKVLLPAASWLSTPASVPQCDLQKEIHKYQDTKLQEPLNTKVWSK